MARKWTRFVSDETTESLRARKALTIFLLVLILQTERTLHISLLFVKPLAEIFSTLMDCVVPENIDTLPMVMFLFESPP